MSNIKLSDTEFKRLEAKVKEHSTTAIKSQGRLEQLLENAKKLYGKTSVKDLQEMVKTTKASIEKKKDRRKVVQEKIIASVPKEILEACKE